MDLNPPRITKTDKDFENLDLKDIKFPVKTRDWKKKKKKNEKEKNSIGISFFGYENKGKRPTYVSKYFCKEKHFHLLLTVEDEKETLSSYQKFQCIHV